MERQLEHAERARVPDLAVVHNRPEAREVAAARADDELANAVGAVGVSVRILRREALVVVRMAVEDDIGTGGVEVLPERTGDVRGAGCRREERVVPVGERAGRRVGGEIGLQPLLLQRAEAAGDDDAGVVGVESDEVPAADVERVVAPARITGGGAEVAEIAAGAARGVAAGAARGLVFVVSGRRIGQCFHATPTRVVRLQERASATALVLVVAEREDGRKATVDEQVRGRQSATSGGRAEAPVEGRVRRVARDVAGGGDDRIRRRRLRGHRRGPASRREHDKRGDQH